MAVPYLASAVNWVKKYADYRDLLIAVSCQLSQCSGTIQIPILMSQSYPILVFDFARLQVESTENLG